jgi:hypothetical protein
MRGLFESFVLFQIQGIIFSRKWTNMAEKCRMMRFFAISQTDNLNEFVNFVKI